MMAKAAGNSVTDSRKTQPALPSCCKRSSHPSVPAAAQSTPEVPLGLTFKLTSVSGLNAAFIRSTGKSLVVAHPLVAPRSQAVLCTFLI